MPDRSPVVLPHSSSGETAARFARRCCRDAGVLIRSAFRGRHDIGVKGRGDIVTGTDLAVEQLIIERISAAFPAHNVLSEETHAAAASNGWTWVLDPIDGTANFVAGIPFFAVNLALCRDGEPLLGLTYDPIRREEFLAVRGGGLRVNGRRAYASAKQSLREARIAFGIALDEERGGRTLGLLHRLWPNFESLRDLGSAALQMAYTACGRIDLFLHQSLNPWDVASGLLQVAEAGGLVTGLRGETVSIFSRDYVGGGRAVHADFLRLAAGEL